MWSRLPPRFVANMLNSHTVVGLAASVLLYVLCLSGTVMVFHEEFARWEQPGVPEFLQVSPQSVENMAQETLAGLDEPPHHFYIMLPVQDMPRMSITADETSWYANAAGERIARVDTPWTTFLTQLHYYLTLPGVLGLTLVGILGVLMTALVFSGVLAHPKLFRDAFKLRFKGNARLRETDTHNRLGVWAMPFHLVVAFTGAALGLASLVAVTLAPRYSEGDFEAFFAPVFGEEGAEDERPAPLADISTALANFKAQHPDLVPWYVSFHDPATVGQGAEILAQHPRRLVYGDNYHFDQEGNITGSTGLADGALGQQVAASLYTLHFGSFGGLLVKLAYGVFGILSTVVVASGINIWLLKRRQRGRPAAALERAWKGTLWGTPFAMSLVLALVVAGVNSVGVHVAVFWIALTGAMVLAMALPRIAVHDILRRLAGALLLVAVLAHAAIHLDEFHSPAAWGISAALLVFAGWLLKPRRLLAAWGREPMAASR